MEQIPFDKAKSGGRWFTPSSSAFIFHNFELSEKRSFVPTIFSERTFCDDDDDNDGVLDIYPWSDMFYKPFIVLNFAA